MTRQKFILFMRGWTGYVTKEWQCVRRSLGQEAVGDMVKEKLEEMKEDRLVKSVFKEEVRGGRPEEDHKSAGVIISNSS